MLAASRLARHSSPARPATRLAASLRPAIPRSLVRRYAQPATKPSRAEQELKRLAREAAINNPKDIKLPEKIIVFHAGTTRTTFLAMLKVTTLLVGAFFCGIVAPTYIRSDKPLPDTMQVVLCGLAPPLFVTLITAPFVTHIHVHVPVHARASKNHLERFIRSGGLSPSTDITMTTLSFISKPRTTTFPAGELVPAHKRFGIVNYVRRVADHTRIPREPWYKFRPAITNFYVQAGRPGQRPRVRYQDKSPARTEWWIWELLKERVAKRAGTVPT